MRARSLSSASCREVGEQRDRVRLRRAVLEREDSEAAHRVVRVLVRERVQQSRARALTRPGMRPREKLQREERRAARGRALVFEPTAEELGLLVEAELADRAIRDRPLPVVAAPRRGLELVVDRPPEVGEGALVVSSRRARPPRRGQSTDASERAGGPTYLADGRMSRPGALLLEDVRRPAGHAGAREHGREERRRDLGDVEHDGRPELDVRGEHALGMARLRAPRARPARAPRRPPPGATRARARSRAGRGRAGPRLGRRGGRSP